MHIRLLLELQHLNHTAVRPLKHFQLVLKQKPRSKPERAKEEKIPFSQLTALNIHSYLGVT